MQLLNKIYIDGFHFGLNIQNEKYFNIDNNMILYIESLYRTNENYINIFINGYYDGIKNKIIYNNENKIIYL